MFTCVKLSTETNLQKKRRSVARSGYVHRWKRTWESSEVRAEEIWLKHDSKSTTVNKCHDYIYKHHGNIYFKRINVGTEEMAQLRALDEEEPGSVPRACFRRLIVACKYNAFGSPPAPAHTWCTQTHAVHIHIRCLPCQNMFVVLLDRYFSVRQEKEQTCTLFLVTSFFRDG